nr:DNA phosphorothioation-associated putative methyltransferase [Siccirubricoccus soli]
MGAFDRSANRIGRRLFWEQSLAELGLRVEDHAVTVRDGGGTAHGRGSSLGAVKRHRTAIARGRLSAPMQALTRWGFIDGSTAVLDYGCGRGDDVRALRAAGVAATGWDPHFAPEEPLEPADVVNLGFVLNVIEDSVERAQTLSRAFALARRVLSVAVMQPGDGRGGGGREYADGVLTRRGTFQRYFGQAELCDYVAGVLCRDPVTVGPGMVFVFRADEEEQAFLAQRQRSVLRPGDALSTEMHARERAKRTRPSLYEKHRELLDAFWSDALELGRLPEPGSLSGGATLQRRSAVHVAPSRRFRSPTERLSWRGWRPVVLKISSST